MSDLDLIRDLGRIIHDNHWWDCDHDYPDDDAWDCGQDRAKAVLAHLTAIGWTSVSEAAAIARGEKR